MSLQPTNLAQWPDAELLLDLVLIDQSNFEKHILLTYLKWKMAPLCTRRISLILEGGIFSTILISFSCIFSLQDIPSVASFDNYRRLSYSFHMGLSILYFNCREVYYFIQDTKPLISAGNGKIEASKPFTKLQWEKIESPSVWLCSSVIHIWPRQVFIENSYPTTPIGFPLTSNFNTTTSMSKLAC